MTGVTFDHASAVRIANTVRRVEKMPTNMAGERVRREPPGQTMWAYLVGCDITGKLWSWVRVEPDPLASTAGDIFKLSDPAFFGHQNAREASGNVGIPDGTVLQITLIGYDADAEPVYAFTHSGTPQDPPIAPHDHRDNYHGGFAFAVYHPGTSLPQMPWAI